MNHDDPLDPLSELFASTPAAAPSTAATPRAAIDIENLFSPGELDTTLREAPATSNSQRRSITADELFDSPALATLPAVAPPAAPATALGRLNAARAQIEVDIQAYHDELMSAERACPGGLAAYLQATRQPRDKLRAALAERTRLKFMTLPEWVALEAGHVRAGLSRDA